MSYILIKVLGDVWRKSIVHHSLHLHYYFWKIYMYKVTLVIDKINYYLYDNIYVIQTSC